MSSSNKGSPFASNAAVLGSLAFIGIGLSLVLLQAKKKPVGGKRDKANAVEFTSEGGNDRRVHILYGTTTGTSKNFANTLSRHIAKRCSLDVKVSNLKEYNDELLPKEDILLIISSTWEGGKAPESCQVFFDTVEDQAFDFRVSKDHMSNVEYSVFGLGGEIYGPNYCKAVKSLDDHLERLGAQRILPVAVGDDSSNLEQAFYKWNSKLVKMLEQRFPLIADNKKKNASTKETTKTTPTTTGSQKQDKQKSSSSSCCNSDGKKESSKDSCCSTSKQDEEDNEGCCSAPKDDDDELEEEDRINNAYVEMEDEEAVVDLEEIGPAVNRMKIENKQKEAEVDERREMVTKLQRKALTKEGYKIIGSHSAVKLCRWTKNQLRGRGGCYKHSFYGITSYQCMEATPSLACANKCVFCWRHHKNPVGTEWRWKEDDPSHIVEEAIRLHVSMINEMKGVPGVQTSRLQEAYTVKHCALSLVGEPIMYPRINEMMKELHDRDISTFLVTNAQFPERIEHLDPVTQLYVSVDAATKDSLKAIDRPLFKDFWERFIGSLRALRDKKQRTVYRMTLVKSWNMSEVEDYVQLIEAGLPGKFLFNIYMRNS